MCEPVDEELCAAEDAGLPAEAGAGGGVCSPVDKRVPQQPGTDRGGQTHYRAQATGPIHTQSFFITVQ